MEKERKLTQISQLEHAKRKSMWVGSKKIQTTELYCINEDMTKMILSKIKFAPAWYKIFDEIEDYKLMSTGQYGGIGAIIRQQNEVVMVVDPHEGFPAQKAGLLAGDVILEVNGKSVENLTSSEVSEKLKGKPGTEVTLKVDRAGTPITVKIVREEIKFSPVPYYGMVSEDVGYIKLSSFTKTASQDVKSAYQDLEDKQGMKKLIFDLRGNGGGLVIEAVKIVNMFVEQGTEIVSIKG
ncbi:S41 family peptidase, partial [uncultured Dokdonia sp.]|uniref:S41 family peptidase n=1 Tax=uncultured Dokdonia sp. TaxID=575653 RepID=UPI00262031BD